jgi:hypothetical protein
MKEPKYIEKENLPLRLAWKEHPKFFIYKYEKEDDNYRLHYLVDDRGMSVHLEDKVKFDKFPNYFEVQSGGWYGDKGRWAPMERYSGTIICEDVNSFNQLSSKGEDFKFSISKSIFSSRKTLHIESAEIGTIELKCKKIIPQKYDILLFSKTEQKWVLRSYAMDNLDSYLDDTIDTNPF